MRTLMTLALAAILVVPGCGDDPPEDDFIDRMAREHRGERPFASLAAQEAPTADVIAQEVRYGEIDGTPLEGYLAMPESDAGDLPGLIVIHEWWGLNDNIRAMTRRLAGEGYRALAVDLYGGSVAETSERAGRLAGGVEEDRAIENLRQAHAWLSDHGAERIGTIGWCFGGGWSLRTALALPDGIDATVIYYGRVETDPAALASLDAPVQGHFGEEDDGIPVERVRAFESALEELGVEHEIHIYPGADHAFANASGERHHPEAARRAWSRTVIFLENQLSE